MTKTLFDSSYLTYVGTLKGPKRGTLGDVQLGQGVAVRSVNGALKLYLGSYNPSQVLSADVPVSLDGPLTNVHAIGSLACQYGKIWGLHWDTVDSKLYQSCHNDYDGDPGIDKTVSRGSIGATGKLVPEGQWLFANRSDKMTEGGVCAIPQWFVDAYPNTRRLGAGFGMYKSVVATGPASMGLALTSFAPPTTTSPIPNTPLLSYPFSNTHLVPRMHRSTDYINDFGGDSLYPRVPTSVGYTTWADWGNQCATWIDTPTLSGFVGVVQRLVGRGWYTNTINGESWRYDLVVYSPDDLGRVANGADPASIQPASDVPLVFPGMPVNGVHADTPGHVVTGVCYEPVQSLLIVGIKFMFGSDASTYQTGYVVFRVNEVPVVPPPATTYRVTRTVTNTETVDVQAASANDAITAAQALPEDDWTITSSLTTGYSAQAL